MVGREEWEGLRAVGRGLGKAEGYPYIHICTWTSGVLHLKCLNIYKPDGCLATFLKKIK